MQAFLTALGVAASLPSPKGQVRAAGVASAAMAWIARQVHTACQTALGQPGGACLCTQKGTSEENIGAVANQSNRRVVRMQAFLTALGVAASLPSPKGQVRAAGVASAAMAWIARQVHTACQTALGQPGGACLCTQKGTSEKVQWQTSQTGGWSECKPSSPHWESLQVCPAPKVK